MYIAGLQLSISTPQSVEALVVLSTAYYLRYAITKTKAVSTHSEAKGGRVKPQSLPRSFWGRIVSPVQAFAFLVPPAIYVGALVLNKFQQPQWMTGLALLADDSVGRSSVDETWKAGLRVAACVGTLVSKGINSCVFDHLGEQWHFIGRRERPRVVQTGPYAWVRHPLYSTVLLQEALWSIMFWSYAPLIALVITAMSFAIKMPIEEAAIQQDEGIREEYREYMKRVPARIIPYVW